MRIADRYVGWQVFFGTVLGVTMLTLVFVLGQVWKEIRTLLVDQGAPLSVLAEFVVLVLPSTFLFTLPWGLLVATLLTFGRLSANNELLGLRMAGLSVSRVALPVFVVAALFSVFCYWINTSVAPAAVTRSKNLVADLIMKDPRAFLQPGLIQAQSKDQRIYIENKVSDGTIEGFHLYRLNEEGPGAPPVAYVHAGRADLTYDSEDKQLSLVLNDAFFKSISEDAPPEMAFAEEAKPWFLPLSSFSIRRIKPRYLTNAQIPEVSEDLSQRIDELDRLLSQPGLGPATREDYQFEKITSQALLQDLSVERPKRTALSFACLALACVGVPLGISARRRETSTGLMLSVLIAALYFVAALYMNKASFGSRSVTLALLWLPNLICVALGAWLFHRANHR